MNAVGDLCHELGHKDFALSHKALYEDRATKLCTRYSSPTTNPMTLVRCNASHATNEDGNLSYDGVHKDGKLCHEVVHKSGATKLCRRPSTITITPTMLVHCNASQTMVEDRDPSYKLLHKELSSSWVEAANQFPIRDAATFASNCYALTDSLDRDEVHNITGNVEGMPPRLHALKDEEWSNAILSSFFCPNGGFDSVEHEMSNADDLARERKEYLRDCKSALLSTLPALPLQKLQVKTPEVPARVGCRPNFRMYTM